MDAGTGEQWGDDPGWRPSLRVLIPYAALLMRGKRRDPITIVRDLYIAFVSALVMFGFVLSFVAPFRNDHNNGPGWAIGIGALAVINLVVVRRVERPLSCESEAALAESYRNRLFVRLAFAESTALIAFVASFFVIEAGWIYFFGAFCSLPAFVRLAPSKRAFVLDQDELTGRGCALSLLEAIGHFPPKPK
jgi:F0F1-type ATP synthase membrane subunit c/vacuolar-type H+-ATPase subunit K